MSDIDIHCSSSSPVNCFICVGYDIVYQILNTSSDLLFGNSKSISFIAIG